MYGAVFRKAAPFPYVFVVRPQAVKDNIVKYTVSDLVSEYSLLFDVHNRGLLSVLFGVAANGYA